MEKFNVTPLKLRGTFLIETTPFTDERGEFARFFCSKELGAITQNKTIVNINYSKNLKKGSVRGLHYQLPPYGELKMPRCIRGSVLDVFVDVRKNSPTFLCWDSVELTERNKRMLIVPEGFAHGFQALEDNSELLYLSTQFYSEKYERALNIADPSIGITLPLQISDISERDRSHAAIYKPDFDGVDMTGTL